MNRTRKTAAILIAVAAVVAIFAVVAMDRSQAAAAVAGLPDSGLNPVLPDTPAAYGSDGAGIWVSGSGTISVEPDLALLDVGVETRAANVSDANSQASMAMDAVITALKARGVQDKDIQTGRFSIYPRYEYVEEEVEGVRSSREVLVGYRVRNNATVKLRDLDAVGEVIDDVVTAGGDNVRISNISFTLEDPKPKMSELREMAVADAHAKAEHLAELSDVSVGRLIYISEGAASPSIRDFARESLGAGYAFPASAALLAAPVRGGEVTLSLSVQAGFAIY
ncbi:MAG: SIMPL domain-containing protein [Chloroflexi bacterium]|nr:SIMPL domain-containing protein [Chloroflexota bacterium]